ncbi:MAG: thiamine pyrophosphate-binding protein [Candidatus Obscuribacterales bacterium]|nr:thiamine pyrophosphate-binding protein [Candidatus Obscuribacterales bacterium]
MDKIKLADYLFKRIQDLGVDTTFGIPGDFALPLYAAQDRLGLKTVVMTHEPSVGFAADAYARLRGFGVAMVTYGAGGLNMVNPIGLAYAEQSPVLVISGSPETRFRDQKPQLHHCVKHFDTQLNVFAEVTESQSLLLDPKKAQVEIDRVLDTTVKTSRPGYLEIPRDMVNIDIDVNERAPKSVEGHSAALKQAIDDIQTHLQAAKQPVMFVGAETRRFHLKEKVVALAEALNIPVVTSILGKASFPESHKNFIGNYFGQFGNPKVREYVESADCILSLGAVLTEMETGGYTAKLPAEILIQLTSNEITCGHRAYNGIDLKSAVDGMLERFSSSSKNNTNLPKFTVPQIADEVIMSSPNVKHLTVAGMIEALNAHVNGGYSIISDVGDCLYAGMSIKTDIFIAPGYYSSMGFGVPAGIGAQVATPERRSIILVGDGGFQMTGLEMSTAVKLGLNPIIIVFNNGSYAMLKHIDKQRDYYNLQRWDYTALAKAVGGDGMQAQTKGEFEKALKAAHASNKMFLIDAVIEDGDISPTLRRLTEHFGAKVRASIS